MFGLGQQSGPYAVDRSDSSTFLLHLRGAWIDTDDVVVTQVSRPCPRLAKDWLLCFVRRH